jgi:hypothetical protein
MYTPLLAAAAVAALIAFAPTTTFYVSGYASAAFDGIDVFDPLTCAMAHSGPCYLTHEHAGPKLVHPKRLQPMLAAMQ